MMAIPFTGLQNPAYRLIDFFIFPIGDAIEVGVIKALIFER